jgi:ABC-2 type transport system ATP-binding protein
LAKTKTIIFSSHILAEISAVTDRITIIHEGKIVADGLAAELRERARKANRTTVELAQGNGEAESALRAIPGVAKVERANQGSGSAFVVSSPLERDVRREINDLARSRGWHLLELHTEIPTLEEAFIELTGKEASA